MTKYKNMVRGGENKPSDKETEIKTEFKNSDNILSQTNFKQQEGNNMTARRTVKLELFDLDAALPVESSLVFSKDNVLTEDNDATTINTVLFESQAVKEALDKHNKVREETLDVSILKNTGKKVFLMPVKLKDLVWKVNGNVI